MLIEAIAEVSAVGRACGVNLPDDIEQRTLAYVESIPPHTTASMQRDILEGRPSELEYQTGSIVRLGKLHGVLTPTHSFIYASLLPLEQRARGKLEFSV
jgi:2-dehydropantoate 2-reductase